DNATVHILSSTEKRTSRCLQKLMEEVNKRAIRQNWSFLIQNIDIISLTDCLREDDTLTNDMCEQIEVERTTRDKIAKFLSIIMRRGPHAFDKLVQGLKKTDQTFIAEKLLQSVHNTPVQASS
ncbi:hypothetical protein CHS0354_004795, partial [Potamilus streckersoni]